LARTETISARTHWRSVGRHCWRTLGRAGGYYYCGIA
jgi:hypothetical protein